MKKYLMNAALTLALGGLMVSCSDDNVDFVSIANQKAQAFEKVFNDFAAEYGGINPNNTWGFTDDYTVADTTGVEAVVTVEDEVESTLLQTRAALLDGIRARTRGVDANGNQWAANGWLVPDPLTDAQKYIVKTYFQNVKNPTYEDPQWTNYFIQQVYKGGTDPGVNSLEKYKAADGNTYIVGSDHMDHLAAINGDFVDHNNNFNKGDCGTYGNVLDNGGDINSGPWHSDKINLMTNSTTKSFGYYNSNSSVRRTEYTGLVGWETIYNWAKDNTDLLNGYSAEDLKDSWNRSYMGFDFEMMIGDDLYQYDRYVKISDVPGNAPQYIWDGEKVIKWFDYDTSWNKVYADGYDEFIRVNGQKINYLINNTNMYAGTRLSEDPNLTNIDQGNLKVYKDYSDDVKNVECLNLPLIKQAFEAGYLPSSDQMQNWVKIGGTADGYYSDWIVTLTKAEGGSSEDPDPTPDPVITYREEYPTTYDLNDDWYEVTGQEGRIFCEDLGQATREDLDYNDVVFDVRIWQHHYKLVTHYWKITYTLVDGVQQPGYDSENLRNEVTEYTDNYAEVILKAAGGTLPLQVVGKEVHAAFGVDVATMVNTRDGNSTAFGSYESRGDVAIGDETITFKGTDGNYYTKVLTKGISRAIDVPIVVNYDGSNAVQELHANAGKAPHKLLVPLGTPWATERKNLALAYPDFGNYIYDASNGWTYNRNSAYIYSGNTASTESPKVFRTVRVINSSDDILWSTTTTFGSSWSLQSQNITLNVDKFWPGDILRFHCKDIPATSNSANTDNQAWINISFDGIGQVYDGQVVNYDPQTGAQSSTCCVEFLITEALAEKMNSAINGSGAMQITVAGRNFTLERVARKPFDK